MAITMILDLKIQPARLDEFMTLLAEILPDTRGYDGCLGLETCVDQDDPNHVVLIERWDSRAHYDRYLAWRTETGLVDTFRGFLSAPPGFTYLDPRADI